MNAAFRRKLADEAIAAVRAGGAARDLEREMLDFKEEAGTVGRYGVRRPSTRGARRLRERSRPRWRCPKRSASFGPPCAVAHCLPNLARMLDWQELMRDLPSPLSAEVAGPARVLIHLGDRRGTRFDIVEAATLTDSTADELVDRVARGARLPPLVVYGRSSPSGRERLREAGLSYVGADGRVLLQAPRLYVDRDRQDGRSYPSLGWGESSATGLPRNPFAVRGSRVARWLLLHPEQSFAISELAGHVELSVAAVSRAVQALDELAVVRTAVAEDDARGREVRLSRAAGLLNAWLPVWQRRRVQRTIWDVGAGSVDDAITLVAAAAAEHEVGWALSGLAGAAEVRRVVEPADALVWIAAADVSRLAQSLMPERARGGRGTVRIAAAPDPWTLGLAMEPGKLPVADPVQLWLDCSSEGERALEAADAVAKEVGW